MSADGHESERETTDSLVNRLLRCGYYDVPVVKDAVARLCELGSVQLIGAMAFGVDRASEAAGAATPAIASGTPAYDRTDLQPPVPASDSPDHLGCVKGGGVP